MLYGILWRVHAILMSTSFIAVLTGITISLLFKKKSWRYRIHKNLGIYAGISGISALITAAVAVQLFSGYHFSSIHAVAGGITGLLLILTPLAGFRVKTAADKKRIKLFHRILGFTTTVMMLCTIILGLIFIGII